MKVQYASYLHLELYDKSIFMARNPFKAVNAVRKATATNGRVLLRRVGSIGTAFDSKVAQEARRLHRQCEQERMGTGATENDDSGCHA